MKAKTKIIIALSLAGVITLGAVIALVVVIASFNATSGSGLKVSYVAKNVEAEVSMGYLVSEEDTNNPKTLNYTSVQAGNKDKLTFSSSDTAVTVSKSFDNLPDIELTKDGYLYLKYTFKHTGTATNSGNYLNIKPNNTFSALNNIKIDYALYDRTMSEGYASWMSGINGLTVTRDGDNECVLFIRISVDVKTQNALIDGAFTWSMTTSDTEYYAILDQCYYYGEDEDLWPIISGLNITTAFAPRAIFDYYTEENLAIVEGFRYVNEVQKDGSGPIRMHHDYNYDAIYFLSDAEIFVSDCEYLFADTQYDSSLESIYFYNFNTQYVYNFDSMFDYGNYELSTIYLPENWEERNSPKFAETIRGRGFDLIVG